MLLSTQLNASLWLSHVALLSLVGFLRQGCARRLLRKYGLLKADHAQCYHGIGAWYREVGEVSWTSGLWNPLPGVSCGILKRPRDRDSNPLETHPSRLLKLRSIAEEHPLYKPSIYCRVHSIGQEEMKLSEKGYSNAPSWPVASTIIHDVLS